MILKRMMDGIFIIEKLSIIDYKHVDLDLENEDNLSKLKEYISFFQESADYYQLIAENTLDIIFQTTRTGTITYISSATERIAGYKPNEMQGKKFTKFVPKSEIPKYLKIIKNTLEGKDIGSFESYVIHKNKSRIPVEFAGKLVKQGNKKLILGTIKDITERKSAEEALINAHNELEQRVKERTLELSKINAILKAEINEREKTEQKLKKAHLKLRILNQELEKKVIARTTQVNKLLEQKDEFVNQLGHDLKNPLNPLINLLPIIADEVKDPEINEMLEVAIINVDYMNNLVVNTIELARINSNNTKFFIEKANLSQEIDKIIEKNKILFEENQININNNVQDEVFVYADKLRLQEIMDNLLTNAIKFTRKNGKITVDSKYKEDFIEISVKDNGLGMNQDQINHIFEEFYKVDESRHDMSSVGLGLSICKRIIEKHGGTIWAESPGVGKGSTIFFKLPTKPNE
jgi:PAS domain S-box-containing protein